MIVVDLFFFLELFLNRTLEFPRNRYGRTRGYQGVQGNSLGAEILFGARPYSLQRLATIRVSLYATRGDNWAGCLVRDDFSSRRCEILEESPVKASHRDHRG